MSEKKVDTKICTDCHSQCNSFYLAGSFKVIRFGERLDPQMKNHPASDTGVRKAKGWNELRRAENVQNYKRAIFVMLRARRTTRRQNLLLGEAGVMLMGDSKWNYSTLSSYFVLSRMRCFQ